MVPNKKLARALACLLLASSPALGQTPEELGGLEELYGWPEVEKNLVKNPSFEKLVGANNPAAWELGQPDYWTINWTNPKAGTKSLRLRNSHRSSRTPLASQSLSIEPGWYSLSGYLRTRKAGTVTPRSGGRLSIWTGNRAIATWPLSGTNGWTFRRRSNIRISANDTPSVRLEAYRKPDGDIYFDSIKVYRRTPPLVEGFLRYPNYRGLLFDDRSQTIVVAVTSYAQELGRSYGSFFTRLALVDASGAIVAARNVTPTTARYRIELDASDLPLGRYRLRLWAVDSTSRKRLFEYPAYTIVKLAASERSLLRSYIDDDNTLVLDGKRRFALGIYDTSARSTDPSFYEDRISKIAEAPFNLYLNYWLGGASKSEIRALTTTLRAHDLSYLHTVNNWYERNPNWPDRTVCGGSSAASLGEDAFTACQSRAIGSLPGVAGWYTADERPVDYAAAVFDQYRILRSEVTDGITFIAQNSAPDLDRWRDASDVLGVDRYPIYNVPEGELSPLGQVTAAVETAQEAARRSRPIWAVIQYFKHGSSGHFPTYQELRSMSYMAVIAGARGLFYWSNGAKGLEWVSDPATKEEYWQRLVRVTEELKRLEPVLLAPDRSDIVIGNSQPSRVRLLAKEVNARRYIFAVNNSPDADVSVKLTLSRAVGNVRVVSESRTITGSGNSFTDVFGPYAVHVYRMDPVADSSSELLVNGGFEMTSGPGEIPGWPTVSGSVGIVSGTARTGKLGLMSHAATAHAVSLIAAPVTLDATSYALEGFGLGTPSGGTGPSPIVAVKIVDADWKQTVASAWTSVNGAEWSSLHTTFDVIEPGKYWVVAISSHSAAGYTVIDDLSLRPESRP